MIPPLELCLDDDVSDIERLRAQLDVLAHDLRNPLAVIMGDAEYLRETVADPDTRALLSEIVAAAQRMSQILKALRAPAAPRRTVDREIDSTRDDSRR